MGQLRQMKRQRRRLHPEPLGDDPGRQTLRTGRDQEAEQLQPGFLGQRPERGNRGF